MTTIKATCPTCGEVALTPDDIELRVDETGVTGSFYGFECPSCAADVRKPADERVVRLLVSGGVPALPVTSQPAPVRLRDRFDFPPLSHDDLLDFHQMLDGDAWFDQLLDQVA
jgi:endogenous inhibitor of DNA gyrase (YacG/DUF329 family)